MSVYFYWLGWDGSASENSAYPFTVDDINPMNASMANSLSGVRVATYDEISGVSPDKAFTQHFAFVDNGCSGYSDGSMWHGFGTNADGSQKCGQDSPSGLWVASTHLLSDDEVSVLQGLVPGDYPAVARTVDGFSLALTKPFPYKPCSSSVVDVITGGGSKKKGWLCLGSALGILVGLWWYGRTKDIFMAVVLSLFIIGLSYFGFA